VEIDLVRIPRVPTPPEIDRVVRAEPEALKNYYDGNQRLFKRPERAFVRRLAQPLKNPQDPKEIALAKSRAVTFRGEVEAGADMVALVTAHGLPTDRRTRGRMSLTPKQEPSLFGHEKGTLTPVTVLGDAVGFYRIEGYAPAMNRALSDPRVQREAGAAVLRETDRLPYAKGIAHQVRGLLEKPDETGLATLVKTRRLRRAKTPAFSLAGRDRIPTLGLAPNLFQAVFALPTKGAVTDIVTVRQDYVVARLLRRETPKTGAWAAAKARYRPRWRSRVRPSVVDQWLNGRFGKARLRVDKKSLDALTVEALRVPSVPVSP
jgi:hypothetical protein